MNDLYTKLLSSDMFSHIKSLKYLPRWVVLIIDTILCSSSYLIVHFVCSSLFSGATDKIYLFWEAYPLIIGVQLVSFWIFHTYSGILRYSGFVDAIKIMLSVSTTMIICVCVNGAYYWKYGEFLFPMINSLLYILLSFVNLFFVRLLAKTAFEALSNNGPNTTRVMVYGTKETGIAIAKMLRATEGGFRFMGFIDDDKTMENKIILGNKVNMIDGKLLGKLEKMKVQGIIVSPRKMANIDPTTDLDLFINNNIKILSVPLPRIIDNNERKLDITSVHDIKAIQIEDLLERPSIKLDMSDVKNQLENKTVMVTGAVGSIGSEIVNQIAQFNPALIILLDQAESPLHDFLLDISEKFPNHSFCPCIADVRNAQRLELIMRTLRPDIIYHAAAYKHVPLMEDNPSEGIQANVMGTKNMADLAVKYGVQQFIMISTDKAVNPTNIMGATKRIAEIYVQSLFKKLSTQEENTTKFTTTRFGNVLGSNGSVIPYFKKQIAKGGPVTVTHPDIIRYFMTIPEACSLVLEAGLLGNGGEIFVFDMGTPVKILDLAKKMIRLAGYKSGIDIKIEFTGLRPGEKLYEELLNKKEIVIPTENPKIMCATVREYDFDEIASEIDELIELSYTGKNFLIVKQMKKIVPEFISKNSPYEKLDA